jgi:hypothetical protein
MNKKELKEKIENVHKNKYIYQRYNGLITKYIDKGDYYIGCNTGIAIEKNEHLLLGKVSENIIDLIEVEDIVNGMEVLDIHKPRDLWEPIEIRVDSRYTNFILAEDIKTVLTKESYMANCYKVGGE